MQRRAGLQAARRGPSLSRRPISLRETADLVQIQVRASRLMLWNTRLLHTNELVAGLVRPSVRRPCYPGSNPKELTRKSNPGENYASGFFQLLRVCCTKTRKSYRTSYRKSSPILVVPGSSLRRGCRRRPRKALTPTSRSFSCFFYQ